MASKGAVGYLREAAPSGQASGANGPFLPTAACFVASLVLLAPCVAQTDAQRRAMQADMMARNPDCIVSIRSIDAGRMWGLTERVFVVTADLGSCRGGAAAVTVFAETAGRPRLIPAAPMGAPESDQIVFPQIDAVQIQQGRLTVAAASRAAASDGVKPWRRQFRFGVKDGRIAELGSRRLD